MIRVLFLTFIILSFRSFSSERLAPPLIKKGEVNLKGFNFEGNATFKLKGEWRFFWKKWVKPKDVLNKQIPKQTSFVPVPRLWNQYCLKRNEIPSQSVYASYLIKISGFRKKIDALRMSSSEKLNFIFLPGLSIKEHATEISGRGVGMDVVKENLKAIKAHLSLESEKNKGTKFTITLHKRTP